MRLNNFFERLAATAAIAALLGAFFSVFAPTKAFGQAAPEIVITWQSNNYAPPSYRGKVLPVRKAAVVLSAEVIDGGKFADLSKKELRWFINGVLLRGGFGLKTVTLEVPATASADQTMKLVILSYKGKNIEKTSTIPLARPEIIIDAPFASGLVGATLNAVRALPFFFNIKTMGELMFEWSANNQKTSGESADPDRLEFDLGLGEPGADVTLGVSAQNKKIPVEFANGSVSLKIK